MKSGWKLMWALVAVAVMGLVGSSLASTIPFSDDFESYAAGTTIIGSNGWVAPDTNYAMVVTESYTFTNSTLPLTNSAHTKIVVLNTEGGSVSNIFDEPSPHITNVYIDTMLLPVYSDSEPELTDNKIKVAFFVNTNGNLVVWHSKCYDETTYSNQYTVLDSVTIGTDQWARVTVTMDYLTDYSNDRKYFKIAINGDDLTSPEGYAGPSTNSPSGPWFICANFDSTAGENFLASIALAGTGKLDDFVVTDENPFGPPPPAEEVTITVVLDPSDGSKGSVDPAGPVVLNEGGTTNFVITPSNYCAIVQILTNGSDIGYVTNDLTLANVMDDITLTVKFGWSYDSNDVPHYMYGVWGWNPNNPPPPDDGDGIPYFEEWLASTDPNDPESYFQVITIGQENGTNYIEWVAKYVDPELGPYEIEKSTNLVSGWFNANPATHPRTEGTNRWWEATPALSIPEFFRVKYTHSP